MLSNKLEIFLQIAKTEYGMNETDFDQIQVLEFLSDGMEPREVMQWYESKYDLQNLYEI